uniref:RNA helicase n=1 Tax=uncultured marine thaumarchaeote AD1000_12_H07 TaxID=1455891 RepID=A0A075FQ27_9ARCH|nr:DEAD/DEAH box helicase domain-containing protein (deaD) [uncultured marine thaumarchaeote AD1000_12_H07]
MTKFEKLGLEKKLLDTLDEAGFTTPFPIQERTIPVLLEGSDVIGQAHTGTGKTAAYALPMLQKITAKQGIQGIIMAPTRELALQITSEINRFAKNTGNRTVTIYGGQGMGIQLDALRKNQRS